MKCSYIFIYIVLPWKNKTYVCYNWSFLYQINKLKISTTNLSEKFISNFKNYKIIKSRFMMNFHTFNTQYVLTIGLQYSLQFEEANNRFCSTLSFSLNLKDSNPPFYFTSSTTREKLVHRSWIGGFRLRCEKWRERTNDEFTCDVATILTKVSCRKTVEAK